MLFILGVLVLIPNYPVMNILLTSFIFVCASHEIHKVRRGGVRDPSTQKFVGQHGIWAASTDVTSHL